MIPHFPSRFRINSFTIALVLTTASYQSVSNADPCDCTSPPDEFTLVIQNSACEPIRVDMLHCDIDYYDGDYGYDSDDIAEYCGEFIAANGHHWIVGIEFHGSPCCYLRNISFFRDDDDVIGCNDRYFIESSGTMDDARSGTVNATVFDPPEQFCNDMITIDRKVLLTRNSVPTCEKSKATLYPAPPCGEVHWSIDCDDLGSTIDQNGIITPGDRAGIVTIRGEANGVEYITQLIITDQGCSSCGGDAGDSSSGAATVALDSVNARFSMGRTSLGHSAGNLIIYATEPGTNLATPSGLSYNVDASANGVQVIQDTNGNLQQVLSSEALANITISDQFTYSIDFYTADHCGTFNTTTGLYEPTGDPFVTWLIENPAASTSDYHTLQITKRVGGDDLLQYDYVGTNGTNNWLLSTYDLSTGSPQLLKQQQESWSSGIRERITRDGGGNELSHTQDTFTATLFTWPDSTTRTVSVLTQSVVDPSSAALTTRRDYYTSGAGKVGKLKSEQRPAGDWVLYDYDTNGRVISAVRPWKDEPFTSATDSSTSRVTTYEYNAIDGHDVDANTDDIRPRTTTESVLGHITSKTYYAYIRDTGSHFANIAKIERCASPTNTYGDANNSWTKTTYADVTFELPSQIEYSDGRVDTYTYSTGTFTYYAATTEPGYYGRSTFAVGSGTDQLTTVLHATTAHPSGVDGKSTFDMLVRNASGAVLMSSSNVIGVGGYSNTDPASRIQWTVNFLDNHNRVTDSYSSNDTHTTTVWGCCVPDSITDGTGIETEYSRDTSGRLLSVTKAGISSSGGYASQDSVATAYTYSGTTTTTTVTGGAQYYSTSRTLDVAGRLSSETDRAGLTTTYAYDIDSGGYHHRETMTRPGTITEITEYYADGRIKSRSGSGIIAQFYDYDVNTDGSLTTTMYSGANTNNARFVKTSTDALGRTFKEERPAFGGGLITTTNQYDSNGRLSKTTHSGMAPTLYQYDELGNQIVAGLDVNTNDTLDTGSGYFDRITLSDSQYVSTNGGIWLVSTSSTYADSSTDTVTLGITRQQMTELVAGIQSNAESVDIFGNTTKTKRTFDATALIVTDTTSFPDSSTNAISITRNGLLQSTQTKTGLVSTFGYDSLGQQTDVTDSRGNTTTRVYDGAGRVESTINAHGDIVEYTYSTTSGRLLSTENAAGKTYFDYTSNGQIYRVWGDAPQPVQMEYNTNGERVSLKTFRGGMGWNASSWPSSPGTADPTTWAYDPATGLLTAKSYADSKKTSFDYDSTNRLHVRTWARQVSGNDLTTTYRYDSSTGELTGIDYSDSTPDVTFSYTRFGAPKTIVDGVGTHNFTYSSHFQQLTETNTNNTITGSAAVYSKVFSRSYDVSTSGTAGRLLSFSIGTNANTNADYLSQYEYDRVGRLAAVNGPGLPTNGVFYDYATNGEFVTQIEFRGTSLTPVATTTRIYESTRDLISSIENKWGSTTQSKYVYVNDSLGRRTSRVDTGGAFASGGFHELYTYDTRSELLTGKRYANTNTSDTTTPVTGRGFTYAFDNVGNRQTYQIDAGASTNYVVDSASLNQYTATTTPSESFTYDDDGNMLSDGTMIYEYDAENRLTARYPANHSANKIVFSYDYMNRYTWRRGYAWNGTGWNAGTNTAFERKFLYDGWNNVLVLDGKASDAANRAMTYGLDLSGLNGNNQGGFGPSIAGMHGAGGVGGLLSLSNEFASPAPNYLYCMDANGNVCQMLASTNGSIATTCEYEPFGKNIATTDPGGSGNPMLFSSKLVVDDLLYFGHRWYDWRLGRWMNRDPAGEAGSNNLYRYASNSPCNQVDPTGLHPLDSLFIPSTGSVWINDFGYLETNGWFSAFDNFLAGGGYAVQLSPARVIALAKLQSFKDELLNAAESAANGAQCGVGKRSHATWTKLDLQTLSQGYDFSLSGAVGSIHEIIFDTDCTQNFEAARPHSLPNGKNCCGCTGQMRCHYHITLSDTYTFAGSNNRLLSWLNSIGTPYSVTSEFWLDAISDGWELCDGSVAKQGTLRNYEYDPTGLQR